MKKKEPLQNQYLKWMGAWMGTTLVSHEVIAIVRKIVQLAIGFGLLYYVIT